MRRIHALTHVSDGLLVKRFVCGATLGINGGRRALTDVPMKTVEAVVKVNLLGVLYCTKVAMDM